jgi:hypothetical protein
MNDEWVGELSAVSTQPSAMKEQNRTQLDTGKRRKRAAESCLVLDKA